MKRISQLKRKSAIRRYITASIWLAVVILSATGSPAEDFDPDRVLSIPDIREGAKKIQNNSEAKDLFLTHSKAFGVSKTIFDFIDKFSGGHYTKNVQAIMDVPKQKWDMHIGLMGGYRIEKVREIVNTNRRVPITSRLAPAMTNISNGLQVISIMRDIKAGIEGDDMKKLSAIEGTVNLVQGHIISEYGGKAMGMAMLGPAVIGTALKKFMAEAKGQYGAYWWEAYSSYLNQKYPKLVQGDNSWASLSESGGYAAVERRLYEFWDSPYANAAEYHGKAGIQTAPALAERTLKDKFAARYYQYYVHQTLKTYYRRKAEQAEAAAYIKARRAYAELKAIISDAEVIMAAIQAAEEFLEDDVSELTITPASAEIKLGQSVTFQVMATTTDEEKLNVTSLVEFPGTFQGPTYTPEESGQLEFRVEYGGAEATATVTVKEPREVILEPADVSLKVGESVTFRLIAVYGEGEREDITALATFPDIFAGASFTAEEPGDINFTASYRDFEAAGSITVMEPSGITISPCGGKVKIGESVTFSAAAGYEDGTTRDVTSEVNWPFATGNVLTAGEAGEILFEIEYFGVSGGCSIMVVGAERLVFSPASATVKPGETVSFTITAEFEDGTTSDVTGRATCSGIASAPAFTAGEPGVGVLNAEYYGATGSAEIVVLETGDITITPATAKVKLTENVEFTVTAECINPKTGSKTREDVTGLASFTGAEGGVFTAVETGDFTVTATYAGKSASASVTVIGPREINIDPVETTLSPGETASFMVAAIFDDGTITEVTEQAAFTGAPGGVYTASRPGEYTVTASFGGKSSSATVRVKDIDKLTISPAGATVETDEPVDFTVTATLDETDTRDVTSLASFTGSPGPRFSSPEPGEFTVTASYGGKSVSANITVEETEEDEEPDLDDAVDAMTGEDEELCQLLDIPGLHGKMQTLVSAGNSAYSDFLSYAGKFEKELDDRAAEPCNNGMIAYCYAGASRTAGELTSVVDQAADLSTEILASAAFCPEEASGAAESGYSTKALISAIADLGHKRSRAESRLASMQGRLDEYGCDQDEIEQNGERYTQDEMDPDMMQDGGSMTEVPGDGVDNDSNGLQDENIDALAGYNITMVLFDSGNLKDDVFDLSVSGFGRLGSTPAGGLRKFGLNMAAGTYTATVHIVVAPDNIGTFTLLVMENGRTIGSLACGSMGDSCPRGASMSVSFTVTGE